MFGLFVQLLDVLAVVADPEEWAEPGQLPMHNLLLKPICKAFLVIVQAEQVYLRRIYDEPNESIYNVSIYQSLGS